MEKIQSNKKETGKLLKICFFLLSLLVLQEIFLVAFDKKNSVFFQWQKKWAYVEAINRGMQFYTADVKEGLKIDEYLLWKKINAQKNQVITLGDEKYSADPFRRLLNKDSPVAEIQFKRNNFKIADSYQINNNFYAISGVSNNFFAAPTDDVVLKSLYCDLSGYDDADFGILKLLHRGDGGYLDTHFLLSLLLLKSNHCYDAKKIDEQIQLVVDNIVVAEKQDFEFSDLYAERIVFLYWAGYGDFVEKEWADKIKNSLAEDSGWRDKGKNISDAHTTGLAILAMLYYSGNSPSHFFY